MVRTQSTSPLTIVARMVAVSVVSALAVGCTAGPTPTSRKGAPHREAAFVVSPLAGYQGRASAAEVERLRESYDEMITGKGTEAARSAGRALLSRNPTLAPAALLMAQAAYLDGDAQSAYERAAPIAAEQSEYIAAQLLVGRSGERLQRIKEAFEAYSAIADRSGPAARRAGELQPRAVDIAGNRVEEFLGRGRLEEAGTELEFVERWDPEAKRTYELVMGYAAVTGDAERELGAVRYLAAQNPSTGLRRRQAALEMAVGDSGEGLRILEELVAEEPEDQELTRDLERAKTRWRMGLLPEDVLTIMKQPVLTRADLAKLLFWLFPEVRYGRAEQGRIASDILDNPHRREIVRVVNLGLLDVDSTLHLFHPNRGLRRGETLASVLRVLALRRPSPACLSEPEASTSRGDVCALAEQCGLISAAGQCLPESPASGTFVEATGFAALDILGGE